MVFLEAGRRFYRRPALFIWSRAYKTTLYIGCRVGKSQISSVLVLVWVLDFVWVWVVVVALVWFGVFHLKYDTHFAITSGNEYNKNSSNQQVIFHSKIDFNYDPPH